MTIGCLTMTSNFGHLLDEAPTSPDNGYWLFSSGVVNSGGALALATAGAAEKHPTA